MRPTSSHVHWAVLLALLATIPAFYDELLEAEPSPWARIAYALAAVAVALPLLHRWRRARPQRQPWLRSGLDQLDLLLAPALLAAALAPDSTTTPWALGLRLLVAFATLARMVAALRHWATRGGVLYLMGLAGGVLMLCGAGFWWLEPSVHSFSEGLWLAFTTAATVGFGDIVPSTPASRIFSVFVVLLGYGVLSLATAAIATSWIETEERRIEREILGDVRHQVQALHAELQALRAEWRAAGRGAGRDPGRDDAV